MDRSAWLRWLAVAGLALHVLTPQGWPWGPTDRDLPWDLSAIPNAVESPVPFFRDLAGTPAEGKSSNLPLLTIQERNPDGAICYTMKPEAVTAFAQLGFRVKQA